MGETLLGKPYGLTPDEQLKVHQVLTASTAIKKTPYMLDLKTMDRKPVLVPQVGDRVKIKSIDWYEKWKECTGTVPVPCGFIESMASFCGKTMEIKLQVNENIFNLKDAGYAWSAEMFEEVYPMQKQINSPFPKIDFNRMADFVVSPLTVPPFSVKGGDPIVAKATVCSMIEDTAKRIAAYTSVQGMTAKPKLKQVKTTRLMKITKL